MSRIGLVKLAIAEKNLDLAQRHWPTQLMNQSYLRVQKVPVTFHLLTVLLPAKLLVANRQSRQAKSLQILKRALFMFLIP